MLFAKKQFVRFKYARELFSFLELECDWHFFRRLVRLGKSFLYRIDNLKPISSPSFQGEKFIHLAKKLIHLHTTSQFTAKYAFSSWNWHHIQFTNHPTLCGWIYKDFCRYLLIRDWCRTEIVLKVKDWIWLWLTSRNGDLWLFFLNWNKLQKGTIVGDYGTQEWFWF